MDGKTAGGLSSGSPAVLKKLIKIYNIFYIYIGVCYIVFIYDGFRVAFLTKI